MKIEGKYLKIGAGVDFSEAKRIYNYYHKKALYRKYSTTKPLFVLCGSDRKLMLHESGKQVVIRVMPDLLAHKLSWNDKVVYSKIS